MSSHAGRWAIVATLGLLGAAPRAHGQSGSPVAEALFNEGRSLYDQKRFDEACPKFRESDRLEPALGSKLNLALCEEARGRVATAWALFRLVIEKSSAEDPRHALAEGHRKALDARLPHVTIRLAADAPRDTTARLGEVDLDGPSFGVPLAVDPGEQPLVVRAAGHEDRTLSVTAVEGQSSEMEVAPGAPIVTPPPTQTVPSPASAPAEKPAPPRLFTPLRIGAVSAAGLGVIGLVLGGVFSAQASSKNDDSMSLGCRADNRCPPAGKAARLDALDAADRATVAVVVGSVLVAGGVALWFVGAPRADVQVGARWGSGGTEVAIRGKLP